MRGCFANWMVNIDVQGLFREESGSICVEPGLVLLSDTGRISVVSALNSDQTIEFV